MKHLERLLAAPTRTVAGLMSGTSLDGIDVAIARLAGSGRAMQIKVLAFVHAPYPDALRTALLAQSAPETSDVRSISQLNVRLAHAYADAVTHALEAAGLTRAGLDLIGSHGQTIHHVPQATACAGQEVTSTLQIGDPSVLANLLRIPVVGDFRVADMALGGQGAPLVPYFDDLYFAHPNETRGLLNLGGIANISVLPADAPPAAAYAFDTGPSNMLIDLLAQRYYNQPYDADGRLARQGHVQPGLLATALADPYFALPPPKSTGREHFGTAWLDAWLDAIRTAHQPSGADLLATATELTARSLYDAYCRLIAPENPLDVVIVAGGGRHNGYLMDRLTDLFAPVPIRPIEAYGLDADAKEALCFAVLGHEYLNGTPTNLPTVTGATRPTLLGKLCIPL